MNGSHGHVTISGINLSLEPPLPISGWFSGLDPKTLAGRALFERTFRERKELISSLLKSKMGDSSPVRVIVYCDQEVNPDRNGYLKLIFRDHILDIRVVVANTSWMHQATYEFEALSKSHQAQNDNPVDTLVFSWTGCTRFTGVLAPLSSTSFEITAAFTYPGMYDINRWKMATNLSFPKELTESVATSKIERTGASFVQTPSNPHLVNVK